MSDIHPLLEHVTSALRSAGAQAVVLFGSFARGEANPQSDVDVLAIGPSDHPGLYEWRDNRLVVASWATAGDVRAQFTNPGSVGAIIPGWREARILFDPQGVAAAIQADAHAWTWDRIDAALCSAHIGDQVAGLAEEALKLIAALRAGKHTTAAIQRSVIALRMAGIMALRRRVLYGSENRLWDMLADEMGDPWAAAQTCALGLNGDPFEATCRAALELYALTAAEVFSDLDAEQRRIVAATLEEIIREVRTLPNTTYWNSKGSAQKCGQVLM